MKSQILIIDDEESALSSLERVLRKDFEVFKQSHPVDALRWLEENPGRQINIVLTDYRMPEMNGLEFLKEIRDRHPKILRTLISGQIDISELSQAINQTLLHRFFLKPWDNEILRLQMLECLQLQTLLQQRDELEKLAITDPVTQLTNHRYLQVHLQTEVERSRRHSRELSLVMIDVDHFKTINDRYGHPHGDMLLREVAQQLSESIRTIDTVSRYGGEEFAILLPDTGKKAAWEIAERARKKIEISFATRYKDFRLTISLGLATFPEDAQTPSDLIAKADSALYRSKEGGRNQTSIA